MKVSNQPKVAASRTAVPFAVAAILALATGCESRAADQSAMIKSLAALEPAVLCIDGASSQNAVTECLTKNGVEAGYRIPNEPRTVEDFTRAALLMWTQMGRGGSTRLTKQHFASAIDYAVCVERATNALGGLSGTAENAKGAGQMKANMACANHEQSMHSMAKRYPGLLGRSGAKAPDEVMKTYMLASIFAGTAYNRTVEANGWVTDAMRPCFRYADGRPPSPGCAGKPMGRPPPPPTYKP